MTSSLKALILAYLTQQTRKQIETKSIEEYVKSTLGRKDYWRKGGYPAFAQTMEQLVEEGVIEPVKAWKLNGLNPPLYNGYRLLQTKKRADQDLTERLLTHFHPLMSMTAYVHNPDQYIQDKPLLHRLDAYLANQDKHPDRLTINERSFAIFGDEKFLASTAGQALLGRVGLTIGDLCCYRTYEPFFYYQRGLPQHQITVLIVENKDTFYSLKSLLQAGYFTWDGVSVDLLIYGEGKKIQRSLSFFDELDQLPQYPAEFLYFGDLDPTGIAIWDSLQPQRQVRPFVFFYTALLDACYDKAAQLRTQQHLPKEALKRFLHHFAPREATLIRQLFAQDRYLPQEGLHYELLRTLAEGKR
ncbi:MAG: DUF2220 family protein [Limnochordia bacterium]|nr:DUF2220 domain-containing protein [Limnochordia bacterium]MDD2629448.1 DUF2220 family protein [Limnochordia bacterium]MDD4518334.1 DUF2220 family protein [Limnochordia bacterium]